MGAHGAKAPGTRRSLRRGTRGFVLALLLAGLGVAAAGCGGGSGPGVANVGTTTSPGSTTPSAGVAPSSSGGSNASGTGSQSGIRMVGASVAKMMALSACMRSHGVPNFPDPNAQGVISGAGLDPTSPQFRQAMSKCQKLGFAPQPPTPAQEQQMKEQALAHSACMRSHGVPNYPDPQFGSGGTVSIAGGPRSGLDQNSPQFQTAWKACEKDMPGIAQGKAGPAPVGGTASNGGGT